MSFRMINVKEIEPQMILGGPIKPVVSPKTVGSKNLRFALGVFNPDEGLVPHIHPESEEVYYVIKGKGTVGTIHGVKNTGKEKLIVAFFVAPGGDPTKEVGE